MTERVAVTEHVGYVLPGDIDARLAAEGWRVETSPPWTHVRAPEDAPTSIKDVAQGWKLHISATILSAPEVLAACAPILAEAACEFKFAHDRDALLGLNDTRAPRGSSGKFITAYPIDNDTLLALAQRLHEATRGMAGPRILSDARLYPDSLVHYRYGAFAGTQRLGNDGSVEHLLVAPDGTVEPDRREAYYCPPKWAVCPFPAPPVASEPGSVLLAERYRVTTAVRHANKGGVYLAEDTRSGTTVVIKEARAHVATDDHGRDARATLEHEAAMLRRLEPLAIAPRVIEVFTAGEHVFLAEEQVPGVPLAKWVGERLNAGESLSLRQWWDLAGDVAALLDKAHGAGVILRDFNPNNIMVDDTRGLRLIDLELAHPEGDQLPMYAHGGTPGSSAPEQFRGTAPAYSVDVFSLGAILLYIATAYSPVIVTDEPEVRSREELIEARLRAPGRPADLPEPVIALVTDLMREQPDRRPTLAEVRRRLAQPPELTKTSVNTDVNLWVHPDAEESCRDPRQLRDEQWDELVDGIVAHLDATLLPSGERRVWPCTGFGADTEPCAVQYGAAGVLAVLVRLHQVRPGAELQRLTAVVHDRIRAHVEAVDHRLPGLYFGAAGTALGLADAARVLDRPDTAKLARELVLDLPRRWPNPDITHGTAGTGTALLTLWSDTGDDDLLEPVAEVADGILADLDRGTMTWTISADFESTLAGYCSYGFAHGTAGIGAFLLSAGQALDRADLTEVAYRCGEELIRLAVPHGGTGAVWHDGPGRPGFLTHWCNGSSGVATLLVRLFTATGERRFLDQAVAGGRAIMQKRWRSGTAYCHGLAGDGDLLLDLAHASGDPVHHAWAQEIGHVLYDRRTYRDGHAVIPNETGDKVSAEFGAGLAGHLAFLLRLRHGGTRLFHPPVVGG